MDRRPGARRGKRLMDVGRSLRAWAEDEPRLAAPLVALAVEVERSARSTLLTLAHSQSAPTLDASHTQAVKSRRPGALG
jgi:hypothetical protein